MFVALSWVSEHFRILDSHFSEEFKDYDFFVLVCRQSHFRAEDLLQFSTSDTVFGRLVNQFGTFVKRGEGEDKNQQLPCLIIEQK